MPTAARSAGRCPDGGSRRVSSHRGGGERETIPPIPEEIAALMHDVSAAGKRVE